MSKTPDGADPLNPSNGSPEALAFKTEDSADLKPTEATDEPRDGLVVEYVALEDFLLDQETGGVVVETTNATMVPVQIVRPQLQNGQLSITSSENCLPYHGVNSLDALADAASVVGAREIQQQKRSRTNNNRKDRQPIPDDKKDQKYWERRQKNNLAARRSRESKREKEAQLGMKAAFLEKEHKLLREEIEKVKQINLELRERLKKYEDADKIKKEGR